MIDRIEVTLEINSIIEIVYSMHTLESSANMYITDVSKQSGKSLIYHSSEIFRQKIFH